MDKTTLYRPGNIILLLILLVSAYFSIFWQLNRLDLHMWDESRLAVNALEMYENHQYLINTFDGKPDLWGTKPPLMIWLQVFFFHICGPSILALRLPSALATLAISLLMAWFITRTTGSFKTGALAALVFLTSPGFIGSHVGRTGDYDALLSFFIFAGAISFFFSLEQELPRKRILWLYLTLLFLILGALTKGIQALLPVPAYLILLIPEKKWKLYLSSIHLYAGIIIFLAVVTGYYLLREHAAPGYLQAVATMELGNRYLSTIESHHQDLMYYVSGLWKGKFAYWYIFSGLSIFLLLRPPDRQTGRVLRFAWITGLTYLLVITFSSTKCEWYDAPFFPFAAILAGITISYLSAIIEKWVKAIVSPLPAFVFSGLLMIILFFSPARNILESNLRSNFDFWKDLQYGKYLRHLESDLHMLPDSATLLHNGYNAPLIYYRTFYNLEKHKNFDIKYSPLYRKFYKGSIVITCQENQIHLLDSLYTTRELNHDMGFTMLKVLGKANP